MRQSFSQEKSRSSGLFSDWRYVDPGYLDWRSADGKRLSPPGSGKSLEPGPFVDAYASQHGVPEGIAIRSQPAQISPPLQGVGLGSVVYEEGKYRLWYCMHDDWAYRASALADKDPAEIDRIRNQWKTLLVYVESSDGFDWKIPELNVIDPKEYAGNGMVFPNAVFGCSKVTHGGVRAQTWKQPAVFIDPHAPSRERYKMVYGAGFGARKGGSREAAQRMFESYRKRWPNEELDPYAVGPFVHSNFLLGLMGATSPDGLHWTAVPEPLALHQTDSNHVVCYDENIGKYVWYNRRNWWAGKRRSIGRSETDDFTHFPPADVIIHPEIDDGPDADWYIPAKTIYPGTMDQYLMFPNLFRRNDECSAVHMFSSFDGINWSRVPGGPAITQGPAERPGTWLGVYSNLVPLPGERVGIMGYSQLLPHKYPRRQGKRAQEAVGESIFWAQWPKGRLAAVEADGSGSFSTTALRVQGRNLVLNLQTKTAGEVRVEVAKVGRGYAQGEVIAGRTFADCDPMHGDLPAQTVTWRGQADLGNGEAEPLVLRFRLRMAKMFAFEIV